MKPRSPGGTPPRGFTLIELLIVIAIIAVLMAIFLAGFPRLDAYMKESICRSNLKSIHHVLIQYAIQSDGWFPLLSHYYGVNIYHPYKYDDNRQPAVTPWQALSDVQLMKQLGAGADSFFCPAHPDYGDESNSQIHSWEEPYTSYNSGQGYHEAIVYFGYTFFVNRGGPYVGNNCYRYADNRLPIRRDAGPEDLVIVADVLKFRMNGAVHTIGWYHGGLFASSANSLFLDGHVLHMEWPELEAQGPGFTVWTSYGTPVDSYWFPYPRAVTE